MIDDLFKLTIDQVFVDDKPLLNRKNNDYSIDANA